MADQGSEGLLSPFLRNRRIQAVTPWLKGKILDYGCGAGLLAKKIQSSNYLGIDRDEYSLLRAKQQFPMHQFESQVPRQLGKFNTVVSLAVIEHLKDPIDFLVMLSSHLLINDSSQIVITTPHPSVDWVHHIGSKMGIFSKHANEEHEQLFNYSSLLELGNQADLKLIHYSRFLLGANQIAVYQKRK